MKNIYFSNYLDDLFLTRFFYFLSFCFLLVVFFGNFLLSSGMDVLLFREVDDLAFQTVLLRVHSHLGNLDYMALLEINDYGYGWIYWFFVSVITYPFYLVDSYLGVQWPLIAAPRQISLLFSILSLLIIRLILRRYNSSELVVSTALLVFILFPTFGYFSMRFGTVSAVMFFSLLAVYYSLIDVPSSHFGRIKVAIAIAIASSIKLSALLIAPMVVFSVFYRMREKKFVEVLRISFPSVLFFVFLVIFLSNPLLIVRFYDGEVWGNYIKVLDHFLNVVRVTTDSMSDYDRFFNAIFATFINFCVFLCFFMLLVQGLVRNGDAFLSKDFFSIVLTVILSIFYLFFFVKNGKSQGVYFSSVSSLLIVSFAFFGRRFSLFFLVIVFLMMFDVFFRAYDQYRSSGDDYKWSHFSYFVKYIKQVDYIDEARNIEVCIGGDEVKKSNHHFFIDNTSYVTINGLSYSGACVSYAWNNFSADKKYCDRDVDFIILDKKSIGFYSQEKFDDYLVGVDEVVKDNLLIDRNSRYQLLNDGVFNKQNFELICEYENSFVFKSI